jgi:hypothetical protein
MHIEFVHLAYIQGDFCCKQRKEDRDAKRLRDKFDGNSVETISLAGQETQHHDADEKIENKIGSASSPTLNRKNDSAHDTGHSKENKSQSDVTKRMRVSQPLQRPQPSQVKRRPRQRKPSRAAASHVKDGDAGNNKHAAARHLPLLELQPALPQPRERVPSRCSRMLQLRARAHV